MTKRMIDPKPYIALVDALNALEPIVKTRKESRIGIVFDTGTKGTGTELDFGGHYSIGWDSETNRWTLISETDDAPNLCSFNQDENECKGVDRCEACQEVAELLADVIDERSAYYGN